MKKQIKQNKIHQPSKLLVIVASLVFILAAIQLVISHQLATTGEQIRRLEKETYELETKSRLLIEEISQVGSLSQIAQKAEALGLQRNSQVVYFTPAISVALK